jgi:hypothetical protein
MPKARGFKVCEGRLGTVERRGDATQGLAGHTTDRSAQTNVPFRAIMQYSRKQTQKDVQPAQKQDTAEAVLTRQETQTTYTAATACLQYNRTCRDGV